MLKELEKYLKAKITGHKNYAIPKLWIKGYEYLYGDIFEEKGENLFVDPYEFFFKVISHINSQREKIDYSKPISYHSKEKNWEKNAIMYGTLPRMTTSFNHKGFGNFEEIDILGFKESGTFLKMIALLPYLKNFNVNTIYMLPISKTSDLFKKGSIGSPYAVKNPLELDESYHDPLLADFSVKDEFKALVEAAHILGMRVVLDFIPRTASRDSDLIKEHPDWFYWIKIDDLADYKPPRVDELSFKIPDKEDIPVLYRNTEVRKHLNRFVDSPDKIDPKKWAKVKNMPGNILVNIIREFELVTPPGFSDWINDPQPTWDDVTFLRLYLDNPIDAQEYIPEDQKPYILFDVIKSSKFPGSIPNKDLWEYISNIIPNYQKKFGIDGARIDMGHALPSKLQEMIIKKAREIDPFFVFIAEELEMDNDIKAKDDGYNVILGNSWYAAPRKEEMYKLLEEKAKNLAIPFIASVETPDTPRISTREFGEKLKYLATFLLYFSPNGIPYINSGQEIGEIQPMNLGLDNTVWGKTVLPPDDEFYGKLAFFDHYVLHWNDYDEKLFEFLKTLLFLRKKYNDFVLNGEFKYVYFNYQDGFLANYSYWVEDKGLIVVGNLDLSWERAFDIYLENTAEKTLNVKSVKIWDGEEKTYEPQKILNLKLAPGGFALIIIN
ncbi:maltodextrin glycosyltransferase [Thermosipho melanesiensis]|uniref:Alpha amylase, catalytic region n=2 Tax=Thermosipho melanesiensis TaxID=46541 RepID=A6LK74_THEM4|nr:alpha-amylase family glycosyl hydrolase [Thermosipho melanesiensis]ABR30325.1 alpha amylase, catalytic region [Thermosipho melanesiensis BI429]APT73491.1 Maltodextrin glycosyltransferase [Thermosipho melanesiensis]OOC37443.1 maltodextrin glycosyltransferase [Thermosipho melanesiensis]OOC39805.1 maltodextrin glycosyltransferase [Thermosipho melanesiensis]OOC39910.1 maltodextrin glycosyltransferase [Thermosipho melanesiensis]